MLSAYGVTDTGRVRKTNEDALFWDVGLGLFVVTDGMGGHNAGEVASQLCVDVVREFLNKSETDSDATMPYGINPQLSHVGNRVATALKTREQFPGRDVAAFGDFRISQGEEPGHEVERRARLVGFLPRYVALGARLACLPQGGAQAGDQRQHGDADHEHDAARFSE